MTREEKLLALRTARQKAFEADVIGRYDLAALWEETARELEEELREGET